jgi:type IV secretory pathway protease TraF
MTRRRWLQITFGAVGAIAVTAFADPLPRLMWNATASVPTGLYAIRQRAASSASSSPSLRPRRSQTSSRVADIC